MRHFLIEVGRSQWHFILVETKPADVCVRERRFITILQEMSNISQNTAACITVQQNRPDRGFPPDRPLFCTLGPRQPWQTAQHPSAIGQALINVQALINDFALVWIQTDFPWPKTAFITRLLCIFKNPEKS